MDRKLLEDYARLIVRTGANVQKGQYVVIRTGCFNEEFAAMVSRECYLAGARQVFIHWQSAILDKVDYLYGEESALSEVPAFEEACHKFMVDALPVLIWLDGDDPDGLVGVDNAKVGRIKSAKSKVLFHYRAERENHFQWVIAGVPSRPWARKVFPDLPEDEAIEALWNAILMTSRCQDGKGVENWEAHDKDLSSRCAYLNSLRLKELHYESGNGTDFTVELIPGVRFAAGEEKTLEGIPYHPNIPTEECFTSPRVGKAEGIVYASKPLSYNGQLVQDFSVRFHEGKAVEVHARTGEEAFRSILGIDEGAAYLGECALVPYHSPINLSGILFFNTLYDENAACHLAVGAGFNELYPGFENMSDDELYKAGINRSASHVDFMIGTKDLSIVGTTEDGRKVAIFRDGDWAF